VPEFARSDWMPVGVAYGGQDYPHEAVVNSWNRSPHRFTPSEDWRLVAPRALRQDLVSLPELVDHLLGTVTLHVRTHQAETPLGPLRRESLSQWVELF
jgi:hypothetical protein